MSIKPNPYHWQDARERMVFFFTTRFIPGLRAEFLDSTRNSMDAPMDIPSGGFNGGGLIQSSSVRRE